MYAFFSHASACDALRTMDRTMLAATRWPEMPRELPQHYQSVTTQRMFKVFSRDVDLTRHGLDGRPAHLLVPKAAQRSRGKLAQFHAWKGALPQASFLRLEERLFVSTPEFALVQLAGWHHRNEGTERAYAQEVHRLHEGLLQTGIDEPIPFDNPLSWHACEQDIQLAMLASEFMGGYRRRANDGETRYQQAPLMTRTSMTQLIAEAPRLYGRNRLERALGFAVEGSASPMETALALMLSLPTSHGGYGLPRPLLNQRLPVPGHERVWQGGAAITPDLSWPDAHLVMEYDSDEHHGSNGPRKLAADATRSNVFASLGHTVLRVTTHNILSPADVEILARQVAQALGIELAATDELFRIHREKLHRLLLAN
jgi:hypothetical protein